MDGHEPPLLPLLTLLLLHRAEAAPAHRDGILPFINAGGVSAMNVWDAGRRKAWWQRRSTLDLRYFQHERVGKGCRES